MPRTPVLNISYEFGIETVLNEKQLNIELNIFERFSSKGHHKTTLMANIRIETCISVLL